MSSPFSACAKTTIVLAFLLTTMACKSAPTRSTAERIELEIAKKLAGWQARRTLKCRTAAMDIALVQADSMILEYAREQKVQLERPARPIRPEEPALRRPSDTLTLAPFLGDTL